MLRVEGSRKRLIVCAFYLLAFIVGAGSLPLMAQKSTELTLFGGYFFLVSFFGLLVAYWSYRDAEQIEALRASLKKKA